ncbi:MAG: hypothetical protein ABFQ53_00290 [Patescibacteria group bacterium]
MIPRDITLAEYIESKGDVPGFLQADLKKMSENFETLELEELQKMRVRVKSYMGLSVAEDFDEYVKEMKQ